VNVPVAAADGEVSCRTPTTPRQPLPPDAFAQTYGLLQYLAPVILDNQGRNTMVFLKDTTDTNAEPQDLKLGDYTLHIKYASARAVAVGAQGAAVDLAASVFRWRRRFDLRKRFAPPPGH